MINTVMRFVWFDEQGEVIVKNTENQPGLKVEQMTCVLLVGPEQFVDQLITRIKGSNG